ncbi:MAG: L-histidine N(alpha)-methyltransferase [Candidatus Omnitrophota bacterium]
MNFSEPAVMTADDICIENYLPDIGKEQIIRSIFDGLSCRPKQISSMFFYDERGSKLFEAITRLPEYYPPRLEKQLIRDAADVIAPDLHDMDIVELGSGECSKIRILLERLSAAQTASLQYFPVDVSESAIRESADVLSGMFPGLRVRGLVLDFLRQMNRIPAGRRRLFCFFGSTLGNLNRGQAREFFSQISGVMREDDRFLLGIDMVKPQDVLLAAYNDRQNVTAEFNRNILNVVNTLTGSDFDPRKFSHHVVYNSDENRIEMYLSARMAMTVRSAYFPCDLVLEEGEMIHTENSHKFTLAQIQDLISPAGLSIERVFLNKMRWFSLVQFNKAPQQTP